MTVTTSNTDQRALDLRRSFDQEFGALPRGAPEEVTDLLAIRIAGDAYALKIRELSGLASNRKIVPLPSRQAGLLGLAGIRGSLVPVYSLAVLLGYEAIGAPTRWLALLGNTDSVALAFDELEGFLRVNRSEICGAEHLASRHHVAEIVRVESVIRMVVDVRSTITALKVSAGASSSTKEH